ncbi:hypothetical protein ACVWXN_001316 [Bradyrhizobium sp. i1.4.4]
MLNEMHQQPVASLYLDTRISIDPHVFVQRGGCQSIADADEAPVHRCLSFREPCKSWKWDRILPGLRPKPSVLECIDVKEVDDVNVVQTSAVGSGRSPSARPQIRLGSARRTRGATGGSPRHYCRRRRDSFERSTLQTPYTDLLGAAFLYRSETIANDLKIVTKRLGCFRVGLPEGPSDDRAPVARAGIPDRALQASGARSHRSACRVPASQHHRGSGSRVAKGQTGFARAARLTVS